MAQPSKKRMCHFTTKLQEEFPFLVKCSTPSNVRCTICSGMFSVANCGRYGIYRHLNAEKHKKAVTAAGNTYLPPFKNEDMESAKAECMWVFHSVKHSQSFDSMDCTSMLMQQLFETKFSCGKTRFEMIVNNVLDPCATSILVAELLEVLFVSVLIDVSSHRTNSPNYGYDNQPIFRVYPLLLRYFHPNSGINIKLLDLVKIPSDTSDVTIAMLEVFKKYNLEDKIVGFCSGDEVTYLGGDNRCSLISKCRQSFDRNIVGVGCAVHIALGALQTAADLLPVDIDVMVTKIYSYFHVYSVYVEALEEFHDHLANHHIKLLEGSKTRWLAVAPAIQNVQKNFSKLKSYFMSQDSCPRILKDFFSNNCSELWLKFMHVQSVIFADTVKMMEGDKTSFSDISNLLFDLRTKFSYRSVNDYVPSIVRSDISKLEESTQRDFINQARAFYGNCVSFLDQHLSGFGELKSASWLKLRHPPKWSDVLRTYEKIQECAKGVISEDELFDETTFVTNYVDDEVMKRWEESDFDTESRWLEVFENFKNASVPHTNCLLFVQYLLCLSGTNSAAARISSLVCEMKAGEETAVDVETMASMLRVKFNMGTCERFHEILKYNPELVEKCCSFENSCEVKEESEMNEVSSD